MAERAIASSIKGLDGKEYFVSKGYNGCTAVATCIIVEDANTVAFVEVQDSFYDSIRKVCEATKSTACKA